MTPNSTSSDLIVEFEFQTTTEETVAVSDFSDKPILIEWAATWCTVCKRNQEAINEIYPDYKDDINFISISFFLSQDTIQDVTNMKTSRGYNWTFGLDVNGYSEQYSAYNGFNWLLDAEQHLIKTWNGTIVTASDLTSTFEDLLGLEDTREADFLIASNSLLVLSVLSLGVVVILRGRKNA